MSDRSVVATGKGAPEVLQVVEKELRPPPAGEARVRVLASSVCLPGAQARKGNAPIPPRTPLGPGCAVVGVLDTVGQGVASVRHFIAELAITGAYGGYICPLEGRSVPAPATLDRADLAMLNLNHIHTRFALREAAGANRLL